MSLPIVKSFIQRDWVDGFLEFGITPGGQYVLTNMNSQYMLVSTSATPNADNYLKIEPYDSILVSYTAQYLWIKCNGYVSVVNQLTSDLSVDYQRVDLPHDLYTSDNPKFRRLRVDNGQSSFFQGREYRTYREFSIPAGGNWALKVNVNEDIILWDITVSVDGGGVRMRTVYDDSTVVEISPFDTPIRVLPKNGMSEAPVRSTTTVIRNGGSFENGDEIDRHRIVANDQPNIRQTVGGRQGSERGVRSGVYYIQLQNLFNTAATGTISSWWEEAVFQ